jgi:hypothetical protein
LAFFVVDGVEQGANRCEEILHFGGMGHTAGMHTQSREAAVRYGKQMPAARVVINSPTTHGAIGLSTDLDPSMTLGCGSWGGNVTSDNVSPIHLMDVKRIAFETKPVNKGAAKTVSAAGTAVAATKPTVKREQIAAIVDQFFSQKLKQVPPPEPEVQKAPSVEPSPIKTVIHELRPQSTSQNGGNVSPLDFVSETDVRNAIEKGEKIYITAKTILTPSARDLGEEKDVFARV